MKQPIDLGRKFAIVTFLSICLLAAGCSKENDEEISKIEITPVPTHAAEVSPTPLPNIDMPLSPMETWCESMMTKPDQEWTREEAKKFSRQCLYNE